MNQNARTPADLTVNELAQRAAKAMQSGQVALARKLLTEATAIDANQPALWLHLAATCRSLGDHKEAMKALDAALLREPRFFQALLMKATLIEREGRKSEAAQAYNIALSQAPADARLDQTSLKVVQHGRMLHAAYLKELRSHLDATVLKAAASASPIERLRLTGFIDITLGLKPRIQQNPTDYYYPGLPPIEFWPREAFPWLADLEAATPRIQQELAAVMAGDEGFAPYVDYSGGIPLDQWAALNKSLDWSAFHFYHHGRRYEDNCARCPDTMASLALLPQPSVEGRMPAAMFSVLKPKTRIPPHTGVANVRLVMHLPLVVPPGCGFRVGNAVREWKIGEAFVFDDTIEHEAWNDSEETRVILIADVWHPHLSATERELIGRSMLEMDAFNGVTTALPL